MLERPAEIIGGNATSPRCSGVSKVVIGVEDNKKNGIEALNKVIEQKAPSWSNRCAAATPRAVAALPRRSPASGCPLRRSSREHRLRRVQHQHHHRHLPCHQGRHARGAQVVTVSGSGVVEPKNLECPIGTPVSLLFDACGSGGRDVQAHRRRPMMGMAQASADFPVAKGTGAVLAFAGGQDKVSGIDLHPLRPLR